MTSTSLVPLAALEAAGHSHWPEKDQGDYVAGPKKDQGDYSDPKAGKRRWNAGADGATGKKNR